MTGQSAVQSGSRNVSRTVLPRMDDMLTGCPDWLTSRNSGAGWFSVRASPEMACARIGSAVWSAADRAIGTTPTIVAPNAPSATTERAVARVIWSRSAGGRSAAREKRLGRAATTARSGR